MDSMIYNKMLHTPIYTGTPGEPPKSRPREKTNDNAFKELLEQKIREESQVSFSNMPWSVWWNGAWMFPLKSWTV